MDRYSGVEDFVGRVRARLDPLDGVERLPEGGDLEFLSPVDIQSIRHAGVLVGLVPRGAETCVILTERPKTMANHPGQVAFPGGKVDPTDHDAVDAALREAHEEVGLHRQQARPIARGAPYLTGTGFRIIPVIADVDAAFTPVPEPGEVDEIFEVPLGFLMDPSNHHRKETVWRGQERAYYEIRYDGHRIWGVTAGIIRTLYLELYGG